MIYLIKETSFDTKKDTMPIAEIIQNIPIDKEIYPSHISLAYQRLSNAIHGVRDFVFIIDGILEGEYNSFDVAVAGIVLTDGVEGKFYFDENLGLYSIGRYARINKMDVVILEDDVVLLNNCFTDKSKFYADDGHVYKFKKAVATTNDNRPQKNVSPQKQDKNNTKKSKNQ